MNEFNHFTLNTGDNTICTPKDVLPQTIFNLKPIVDRAKNDGKIHDVFGMNVEITMEDSDLYVMTIYCDLNDKKVPVFISMGTSNDRKKDSILEMSNNFRNVMSDGKVSYVVPYAPVVVDVVLPAIVIKPELLKETADFSRCVAWTILDPMSVIGV